MNKVDVKFEIKAMGKISYIPVIIIGFILIYYGIFSVKYGVDGIPVILSKLETLFAPSVSIWVIYLFYDYYENKNIEILLSYPLKNKDHVANRIIALIVIYALLLLGIGLLFIKGGMTDIMLLLLQLIPQVIFFAGLAGLIINLFKNIGIAITILVGYISIELLTEGKMMPWYHVFYFNSAVLSREVLIQGAIINIFLGSLMLYLANGVIREK